MDFCVLFTVEFLVSRIIQAFTMCSRLQVVETYSPFQKWLKQHIVISLFLIKEIFYQFKASVVAP